MYSEKHIYNLGLKAKSLLTGEVGTIIMIVFGADNNIKYLMSKKKSFLRNKVENDFVLDVNSVKVIGHKTKVLVDYEEIKRQISVLFNGTDDCLPLKFGSEVESIISDFKGIATGIAVHINACVTVRVQPSGKSDTEKATWFSRRYVKVLNTETNATEHFALSELKLDKQTGGPHDLDEFLVDVKTI